MAIKITRNDAGNCITFVGSTNPVYWNACLEGQINEDDQNNIDVINKIRTVEEGKIIYEFFNLPYTYFQDKDGNDFVNPSDCAIYITDNANVLSNTGTFVFSQTDTIDCYRDSTSTTVLFSNGDIYAVNSLHASAASDGTISIATIRGDKDIYQRIRYYNVSVLSGAVSGFNTIGAAVDRLNEVLSGVAVGSNTGNTLTTVATTCSAATFTVYGDRITETGTGSTLGYTSTADGSNFDASNGFYSNELISEHGEHFEFEQNAGDWTNSRGVYIGLFDETTYDVADLDVDVAGNDIKGALYLRLYPTTFAFADLTNGFGRINEAGFSNNPNTSTKFRVGIDNDNRIYVAHETSPDVFQVISRSEESAPDGTEFRFFAVMPFANELNGIRNMTICEAVEGAELTWNYIESPDTDFHYPLFSSQADAELIDELYGTATIGNGASVARTYIDEFPTSQTWYMPQSYIFEYQTAAPPPPTGIVWNEIQTFADSNYVPAAYSQSLTVNEGDSINFPAKPLGDSNTYNVTNVPAGLTYDSVTGYIQGTAPEVTGDTTTNPSDVYTISVTIANTYGSSVGSLVITVNNLTAPAIVITGLTLVSGSNNLFDSNTLDDGSAVVVDDSVEDGYRLKMNDSYVNTNILPALQAVGDIVYVGFGDHTSGNWGTITDADFTNGFRFQLIALYMHYQVPAKAVEVARIQNGVQTVTVQHAVSTSLGYDFYLSNDGGRLEANYNIATTNKELEQTNYNGGAFNYTSTYNTGVTEDKYVIIAAVATQADISTTGISEHALPVPAVNSTNWTKALDFSGSSEYVEQASGGKAYSPILMGGVGAIVAAPSTSTDTSSATNSKPWATSVVFKYDGSTTQQHIWNLGAGLGASVGDTGYDNIYLKLWGGDLYLGWGREGALNECRFLSLGTSGNTNYWHGIYIAHNGTRLSSANATAQNLADAFDIRWFNANSGGGIFQAVGGNRSTANNWNAIGRTGAQMDRQFTGSLTIGGRGANRNFYGKVASMVVTTLRRGVSMPDSTEIDLMVTDPKKWLQDYRVGQTFRPSNIDGDSSNFTPTSHFGSTQIWLMGDGTSDSYSGGIRNEVNTSDQNNTKLNLISMVSNDIETVTITGLS